MSVKMKSFKNTREELDKLPTKTSGLYYFYDENRLLYVGKARNLRSRITEHEKAYDFHKQGMFYKGIIKSKGWHSEEDWSQNFQDAILDWRFNGMSQRTILVIDYIFYRIKRIEIEEMPFESVKQREKEQIKELQPPFNYQTASEEYYQVKSIVN